MLRKSGETLSSARALGKGGNPDDIFTLAYEAMLKASLALMRASGFRPRTQLGHHRTLVTFATEVLGNRFSSLTATYERMRKKRNQLIYNVTTVTRTEADAAAEVAARYLEAVKRHIKEKHPQQSLL